MTRDAEVQHSQLPCNRSPPEALTMRRLGITSWRYTTNVLLMLGVLGRFSSMHASRPAFASHRRCREGGAEARPVNQLP